MGKRKKSAVIALLPLVLLPLGYLFIGFYRQNISMHVPPCPARLFLRVYCPGCGGSHCLYDLAAGDLLTALRDNALFVAAGAWLLLFWVQNIFTALGKKIKLIPESRNFYLAVSGIAVAYCVLRNLIPALAPVSLWF
ncbi:MAG: DUF2752 domain-containing protein [Ruminococcus sp.]|nr:DUF2752 domain-containing protein [Ruminococcus sp.]